MPRRPSPSPSPSPSPADDTGTPVPAGRGVPVEATAAADPAAGVVPRMRRPRGSSGPAGGQGALGHDPAGHGSPGPGTDTTTARCVPRGRGTALELRIGHHLARMQATAHPTRPGAFDDDRARRDPDTASLAVVRPAAADAASPPGARVTTAADRPRTAEFPAVPGTD